jgi:hypothetical protein
MLVAILPLMGLIVVIAYLLVQRQHYKDVWQRFRRRHEWRRQHPPPPGGIDPNFQFDDSDPVPEKNQA